VVNIWLVTNDRKVLNLNGRSGGFAGVYPPRAAPTDPRSSSNDGLNQKTAPLFQFRPAQRCVLFKEGFFSTEASATEAFTSEDRNTPLNSSSNLVNFVELFQSACPNWSNTVNHSAVVKINLCSTTARFPPCSP